LDYFRIDDRCGDFRRAVAPRGDQQEARYCLGLADEQDGPAQAAVAQWRAMLDAAPPDAPWTNLVRAALARATGESATAPGPSAGDVAAASNMCDAQRPPMVLGMVQRLADRLHTDGSDVDSWLRLVRAYIVLGDRDKAKDAAVDAKRTFSDHPAETKRIDDLVKGLGLEG